MDGSMVVVSCPFFVEVDLQKLPSGFLMKDEGITDIVGVELLHVWTFKPDD